MRRNWCDLAGRCTCINNWAHVRVRLVKERVSMDIATAINSAVPRWMMFASSFLPCDLPDYWDIVATFANIRAGSTVTQRAVSPAVAKMTIENMQVIHPDAFVCDKELTVQLVNMEYGNGKEKPNPLGIPLVPNNSFSLRDLRWKAASQERSS